MGNIARGEAGFFLPMTTFHKPSLQPADHINILQRRGLNVPDIAKAERYLRTIGYYRLSAYCLPFQSNKDVFADETSFEDILSLYIFDRKLRLLVMDAVERIEVAVRSVISDVLCTEYNPHWFLDESVFNKEFLESGGGGKSEYGKFLNKVKFHTGKSNTAIRNTSCKHYYETYSSPEYPPSWMIIEVLPMGTWSKIYPKLVKNKVRQRIAKTFKFRTNDFGGWLHSLTLIRNNCAHHSRFWNNALPPKARNVSRYTHPDIILDTPYMNLALVQAFLRRFLHSPTWSKRLFDLLDTCPLSINEHMRVPTDWDQIDLWR